MTISFGRWAKSLQDFHVLWSMMFVSLCEAGAAGLTPQCIGKVEIANIGLSRKALEEQTAAHLFSFLVMSGGSQANQNKEPLGS